MATTTEEQDKESVETLLRNPARVLDLLDEIDKYRWVEGPYFDVEGAFFTIRRAAERALLGEATGRMFSAVSVAEVKRIAEQLREKTRPARERAELVAKAREAARNGQ